MVFNVTQEHIDKGKREECQACPIALSISEYYGKDYVVIVGADDVIIERALVRKFGPSLTFELPQPCIQFINLFDEGHEVRPFSFELPL